MERMEDHVSKFQKRHYETIAAVFNEARDNADLFDNAAINGMIDRVIVVFERDNPRVDRQRFMLATGRFAY